MLDYIDQLIQLDQFREARAKTTRYIVVAVFALLVVSIVASIAGQEEYDRQSAKKYKLQTPRLNGSRVGLEHLRQKVKI